MQNKELIKEIETLETHYKEFKEANKPIDIEAMDFIYNSQLVLASCKTALQQPPANHIVQEKEGGKLSHSQKYIHDAIVLQNITDEIGKTWSFIKDRGIRPSELAIIAYDAVINAMIDNEKDK